VGRIGGNMLSSMEHSMGGRQKRVVLQDGVNE